MITLGDPAVLQAVLARAANLRANDPAQWGRMSAYQAICYLADSFRAVIGDREVSPATGLVQRTAMKWFALHVPLRWPRGLPTRPEVEQGVGGTPQGEFERGRADLIALIERFCDPSRDIAVNRHPIFGGLTRGAWLRWGYLHTDHHPRQFGA